MALKAVQAFWNNRQPFPKSKAAQHPNFNSYRRPFPKSLLSYTKSVLGLTAQILTLPIAGASISQILRPDLTGLTTDTSLAF